jgi:hypothetical protein
VLDIAGEVGQFLLFLVAVGFGHGQAFLFQERL